ncbi:CASP-like protein 4D1 [Tasmannia lanceolata]|uniref:CASP-like protein 4D1 n=1 Tax=Tasmannia lanceolata TaxID=3420 RepID=UPI004063FE1B
MAPPSSTKITPPSSNTWQITVLLLRLFTFLFLAVSIILITTDTITIMSLIDLHKIKIHFNDIYAFRFVLSAGVIGCAYTLVQIPFAIYFLSMGKRIVGNQGLLQFDFYGDKIILVLLAGGVGAGFGASVDFKRITDSFITGLAETDLAYLTQPLSKFDKYFTMADVSTIFLLLGLLCMVVLSVLSSIALANK